MRQWVLLTVLFAGIIALGLWLGVRTFSAPTESVPIGGPFVLKDPTGHVVRSDDFRDKKALVLYFGYTFCPDICPTALANLSKALELLGTQSEKIAAFFVTVDPGRDQPGVLEDYMTLFDPRIKALTETEDVLLELQKIFKVYAQKTEPHVANDPNSYSIDHSSIVYIITPTGSYLGHFSHDTEPTEMARVLREIIQ